uniref:RNA polymerase sigma-54 factor n=1 Tax=candidate division WOR-3 bacterium TaxID=2052148 RepID=A0A7C4YH24_UNCW3
MNKNLSHKEEVKLEHRLTPEQVFILNVLQTPKIEVVELVANEIIHNPALLDIEYEPQEEIEDIEIEDIEFEKELREIVKEDILPYFEPEGEEEKFLEIPAKKPSMKEYLKGEIVFKTSEEEILNICGYIIELLNPKGFLEEEHENIARDLNVSIESVLKAIDILKEIEPGGFGLKGTKEYLLYQIRKENMDPLCEKIIREFYEEMLKGNFDKISKRLNISVEDVKKEIEKIKRLKPFPSIEASEDVDYVIPDIIVEMEGEEINITINELDLPFIYINPDFVDIVNNEDKYDRETVKFAKEKLKRAFLFIKGLEMRRRTFRNMIEFIIKEQREFLLKGEGYKKPLRFMDISEKLNVSVSTCSRLLKDVYVQFNDKVYNIKDFFSPPSKHKKEISRDYIKETIKKIISEEKEPLKDTEILKILLDMGIKINRRTVSKYREELNIPPYNIRRRKI